MTQVLVLGGTGWLSGRIARRWRDAGAQVTCLARGERPSPNGTLLLRGDRDDTQVFDDLRLRQWDEVVDVSSRADHVQAAVAALGPVAGRWTYISSLSVYSDDVTVGGDESAPRHAPAQPGDEYEYGAQKVAAEDAVQTLGDRAAIIRPGLIVGAGDGSDRFGYWAAAFARAGDGPVLLPPTEGASTQVIDVEDVADFALIAPAGRAVNAIGDQHPLGEVLQAIRTAAGHTGEVVTVSAERLLEQDVNHWMGERSLPLWLPDDMPGFMTHSNAAYRAAGGELRPLEDTIADVLADERERGVDRERRSGLSRAEELALLG
ncbi:NAD-dependent epimerase/dehydratase family protein [Microbacterium sp. H1-D42]|uniref:NAD-dependent epimerase/dehydratase family protein n=1 Tax=Microbacterium sp. H1-D42 TaxID=2925844 RepID=UPI001F52F0C8|nr:NAD-dependent epimerase/dehydratase family protein [Microbacterium sp. H1-D42]UNK72022.1 reductase [Microbacterium sp. H1-D42]